MSRVFRKKKQIFVEKTANFLKSGISGFRKTSIFLKIGNFKKIFTLAIPEFKQTSVVYII